MSQYLFGKERNIGSYYYYIYVSTRYYKRLLLFYSPQMIRDVINAALLNKL